jgi:hypothetical protein
MANLSSVIRPVTVALTLALAAGAARAESITAESIISEAAARQRAMQRLPAGAEVTATRCREIGMAGGSFRYRCSVEYRTQPEPQGQP